MFNVRNLHVHFLGEFLSSVKPNVAFRHQTTTHLNRAVCSSDRARRKTCWICRRLEALQPHWKLLLFGEPEESQQEQGPASISTIFTNMSNRLLQEHVNGELCQQWISSFAQFMSHTCCTKKQYRLPRETNLDEEIQHQRPTLGCFLLRIHNHACVLHGERNATWFHRGITCTHTKVWFEVCLGCLVLYREVLGDITTNNIYRSYFGVSISLRRTLNLLWVHGWTIMCNDLYFSLLLSRTHGKASDCRMKLWTFDLVLKGERTRMSVAYVFSQPLTLGETLSKNFSKKPKISTRVSRNWKTDVSVKTRELFRVVTLLSPRCSSIPTSSDARDFLRKLSSP